MHVAAYVKTARLAAASDVREGPLFLVEFAIRLARVAAFLSLWRVLLPVDASAATGGLRRADVLTYTLLGEVLAQLLSCRTQLEFAFWDGTITSRYTRPLGVFGQLTAEAAGRWLTGLLYFSVPLVVVAPLLGVDPRPASWSAAGTGVISVVLAVMVGLGFEYLASGLAIVAGVHPYIFNTARNAITFTASGLLIPLALFPAGLGRPLGWSPFAAMASAPLRILTGTGRPVTLLAAQLFWAIVLWTGASRLWTNAQEKVVSFGG